MEELDSPEDILSSSLSTLYGYHPITLSSAGSSFTFTHSRSLEGLDDIILTLRTPDTHSSNWSLHASSIWAASLFLADHLEDLHLSQYMHNGADGSSQKLQLLELGAAAGLPGILIAKKHPDVAVVVSDYPDEKLMQTLTENVESNAVANQCRVVPYAWGSDHSVLVAGNKGFDIVIAADTLWNPELHGLFIETLRVTLKQSAAARIHLFAGLHTGRYTIQSFLDAVSQAGFVIVTTLEREVNGTDERVWDVSRAEGEDEKERRRWVVSIVLKWS